MIFFSVLFGGAKPSYSLSNVSIPGIYIPGQSKTEFKICQIRRIFCGKTALVIVAISVFIIGIMLLNNKLQWWTAMLMTIGMIVFYNAEDVVTFFGSANAWNIGDTSTFILNPTCSCSCNFEIEWLNPISWFNGDNQCH